MILLTVLAAWLLALPTFDTHAGLSSSNLPADAARLEGTACPRSTLAPMLNLPRARHAVEQQRHLVIVAIGSSSTEGSQATAPGRTYPAMLRAALARALPGVRVDVLNMGIGGQDAAETMARFDTDVIAHRPALTIWQVGANGALRDVDPGDFRGLISVGIARLKAAGIDVVLMDNQRAPQIAKHPRRVAIEQVLAEQAVARGAGLFPRGALMDGWAASGHPHATFLAADGLHHNDRGYACVAEALATAILSGLKQH